MVYGSDCCYNSCRKFICRALSSSLSKPHLWNELYYCHFHLLFCRLIIELFLYLVHFPLNGTDKSLKVTMAILLVFLDLIDTATPSARKKGTIWVDLINGNGGHVSFLVITDFFRGFVCNEIGNPLKKNVNFVCLSLI